MRKLCRSSCLVSSAILFPAISVVGRWSLVVGKPTAEKLRCRVAPASRRVSLGRSRPRSAKPAPFCPSGHAFTACRGCPYPSFAWVGIFELSSQSRQNILSGRMPRGSQTTKKSHHQRENERIENHGWRHAQREHHFAERDRI